MTDRMMRIGTKGRDKPFLPVRAALGSWAFLLLWMAALLPRLAIAAPFLDYPIALDDMFQYDMLARSIKDGHGYRWYSPEDVRILRPYLSQFMDVSTLRVPEHGLVTTFRPPGYPLFLSLVYRFTMQVERLELARLVQCALGALLAPLVAWLALQLGLSRKAAVLSGLSMGFYPILILYPIGLASENLFIPLLAAGVASILWARKSPHARHAAIPGILFAAAMLTRSVMALPVLLAGIGFARVGATRWRGALLMLTVAFGLCLPWSVRNSLVSGRPVFLETSLGYQMFIGYHPDGNGTFISSIAAQPLRILDDIARDQYCTVAVMSFIRDDPLEAASRIVHRLGYFFGVEDRELIYFYSNSFFTPIPQPWLTLLYLAIISPWMAVCLLAPLGIRFMLERGGQGHTGGNRGGTLLLLLVAVGYLVPHLLIIAEPRFHLAMVPLLIPLAWQGWQKRPRQIAWRKPVIPSASTGAWLATAFQILLVITWVWGFSLRWSVLHAVLSPGGEALRLYY